MPCCGQGRRAAATMKAVKAPTAIVPAPVPARIARPVARPVVTPPQVRGPRISPMPPNAPAVVAPRPAKLELPDGPAVLVRSLAGLPLRIVGAATGRSYDFRAASAVRLVAREDAVTLLASPSFRLA